MTGVTKINYDPNKEYMIQGSKTEPTKATGRWIEKEVFGNSLDAIDEWQSARCSVCDKYHTTPYMYYFDNYNFCPNCGAKMEVTE